MRRYFDESPTMSGDCPLPKGRANVAVYELMSLDTDEIFRNPIGRGWTSMPLKAPIIAETILGVIEIVSLPHAEGNRTPRDMPDTDAARELPAHVRRKCRTCPDNHTIPLL